MKSKLTVTLLACALVAPLAASARLARDGDANVSFNASGPGGLAIVGTTSDLTVDEDDKRVAITVPLAHLATGISLRDRHMREKYLQVQTYPTAVLEVPHGAFTLPAAGAETTGDAAGTMTLHGQSRPVRVHYTARRSGDAIAVSGSTHINMKEFGIDVPSYLGVTVKPEVDVTARFTAKDRP